MQTSPAIRRSLTRIACAGALFATLAGPALADKTSTIKLKIGIAFTETIAASADGVCPYFEGHLSGAGFSTDLGAVTVQATDCFVPTDPSGANFMFMTKPGTSVALRTASGDTLFGTYQGTATGQPYPIEALSGTVTFAGGTGRFAKASGTGTLEGVENIGGEPATGVIVISGKVTY